MDQTLESMLAQLRDLSPEDWAIGAAVLFSLLIVARVFRTIRRLARYEAKEAMAEQRVPDDATPHAPQRPVARTTVAARTAKRDEVRFVDSIVANEPDSAPEHGTAEQAIAKALKTMAFDSKSLMRWQEYCLLRDIEGLLARLGSGHRLFCHVGLGEFFAPAMGQDSRGLTDAVGKAIASYRADFLIVDRQGYPALGLGFGRTDPVVGMVFARADVPCMTVAEDYDWTMLEPKLAAVLAAPTRKLRKSA